MDIVLASHNRHKLAEFQAALADFHHRLLPLDNFPEIGEIAETGASLLENALIKARTVFDITGLPTVADDTGLEVDALHGAPGVYSARWAGPEATYADNNRLLLSKLAGVPAAQRTARFHSVIAYRDNDQELWTEGKVEGSIMDDLSGADGFGYDPLFRPDGWERTFAELSMDEKNNISHRGLAIKNFRKLFSAKIQPELK